ncbi:J domain-containing protein required for chloroplast accumulation response 1-like isoform X2 [Macadamia integrifolia]|uniref:J domain-containing protein required for chloroplast accumulation response 1-like isoform X2 n=1 Tax=Macadamia integrifolia TaxID=60698 RepID=UPI001C4E7699|nr:J domain-containing protein required for chloroplast accumulation response 1-like isoform X2 [Macadamia integrifolia]
MERFSYRDHILSGLGHSSPRTSFGDPGSLSKNPSRNSDLDFSDVFGGPPRHSSVHGMRHSLGNTQDSYENGVESEEEEKVLVSRSSWSVLREKPVFGEEGLVRRRYPSANFLDDIFRGDQSSSSTPRKPDRDPFSSTQASRILSPVCPASKPDQHFGPSSLPRQLSLPSKLAKGMEFPVSSTSTSRSSYRSKDGAQNSGFPSSPCAFTARVSNQVILQGQEDLKIDARPCYRQSPLSHEFPLSSGESSKAIRCGNEEKREHREKGSIRSEMHEQQCHFSIYKWASKGVLAMPFRGGNSSSSKERGSGLSRSRLKERGKIKIVASELSNDIPSLNDNTSSVDSSFHIKCENQGSTLVLNSVAADRMDSFGFNEKSGSPKPDIEPPQRLGNITTVVPHSLTIQKEVEAFSGVSSSSPGKGLRGGIKKEANVSKKEKGKAELKSLRSLLYENSDGQGKDGMVRRAEGKEDKSGRVETIGKSSGNIAGGMRLEIQDKRKISDLASNSGLQGSGENARDNFVGNKLKGKIKEFVKIFNQEAPPNNVTNVGTQDYRWKKKGTSGADDAARVSATKADGKKNVNNLNMDKTMTNGQTVVDQTLEQPEKSHFILNNRTHKAYNTSSGLTGISVSSYETIPASFKAPLVNVEEYHHEDLLGSYLVKESSANQNRQQQTAEYCEEIQISEARIRQWSNGKETNIRALLSTLQYVLWPESGWKPVPLVDIIEGNSVKKAYQKALLCLHPDKLQQKGVAPQQKYVAEKVYDILQDAWTHFNSLSTF